MLNHKIEAFMDCDTLYNDADIVLFGAPFDSTTSFRPGARFAGKAIRADSFGIETYSPYQDADLLNLKLFDGGDLELPIGNAKRALVFIENYSAQILCDGKTPVMVGGEHLVTLGAVRAAIKKYPNLHIIHMDAHADVRDEYLGEKLSHATVMRRIWDLTGDGKIFQFGIRSGDRQEFDFAGTHTHLHKYNLNAVGDSLALWRNKPVYLSIDLDVLDPSVFPGTGTPEPGGVGFAELHKAILSLKGLEIVGCDIVELSPAYDQSGASTAVACKILRELLLTLGGK